MKNPKIVHTTTENQHKKEIVITANLDNSGKIIVRTGLGKIVLLPGDQVTLFEVLSITAEKSSDGVTYYPK